MLWALVLLAVLLAGPAGPAGAQPEPVVHTVIPPSRTYAYTTDQQGAVRITRVDATIDILEMTARTTLEISLENMTGRRQEAELIIPVAEEAVVCGFALGAAAGMVRWRRVRPVVRALRARMVGSSRTSLMERA